MSVSFHHRRPRRSMCHSMNIFCNCRYYPQLQNSTKCHFNRPGKTKIRSVTGILALFCYSLTFGLFQFMGVSTTRPILSMWILIYSFSDTSYVWVVCGFTNRHLHQRRISEHKSSNSSIGRHMKKHGVENPNLKDNFSVLKECRNKFKCPVYELLLIQERKPSLSVHRIRFFLKFSIEST